MKVERKIDGNATIEKMRAELHRGIVGQGPFIDGLLLALLANGHALVESVPGLAKTRAVQLLAKITGLEFKRIQFTPDLLPADIVGTRIYNQSTASFETRIGPVFANFVLADEINRAPAKVQSALLECMQERQITIGEETHKLPQPFFVFATQNPVEQEGTYQLPEAQLDRFMLKLVLDYPSLDEETEIVEMVIEETSLPDVGKIVSDKEILALQSAVRAVHIEKPLIKYIAELIDLTRHPGAGMEDLFGFIAYGASPRASIALAQLARAAAFVAGRDHVLPDDIKDMLVPVLRHRIIMTYHAQAEGITPLAVIEKIGSCVKVP